MGIMHNSALYIQFSYEKFKLKQKDKKNKEKNSDILNFLYSITFENETLDMDKVYKIEEFIKENKVDLISLNNALCMCNIEIPEDVKNKFSMILKEIYLQEFINLPENLYLKKILSKKENILEFLRNQTFENNILYMEDFRNIIYFTSQNNISISELSEALEKCDLTIVEKDKEAFFNILEKIYSQEFLEFDETSYLKTILSKKENQEVCEQFADFLLESYFNDVILSNDNELNRLITIIVNYNQNLSTNDFIKALKIDNITISDKCIRKFLQLFSRYFKFNEDNLISLKELTVNVEEEMLKNYKSTLNDLLINEHDNNDISKLIIDILSDIEKNKLDINKETLYNEIINNRLLTEFEKAYINSEFYYDTTTIDVEGKEIIDEEEIIEEQKSQEEKIIIDEEKDSKSVNNEINTNLEREDLSNIDQEDITVESEESKVIISKSEEKKREIEILKKKQEEESFANYEIIKRDEKKQEELKEIIEEINKLALELDKINDRKKENPNNVIMNKKYAEIFEEKNNKESNKRITELFLKVYKEQIDIQRDTLSNIKKEIDKKTEEYNDIIRRENEKQDAIEFYKELNERIAISQELIEELEETQENIYQQICNNVKQYKEEENDYNMIAEKDKEIFAVVYGEDQYTDLFKGEKDDNFLFYHGNKFQEIIDPIYNDLKVKNKLIKNLKVEFEEISKKIKEEIEKLDYYEDLMKELLENEDGHEYITEYLSELEKKESSTQRL